MARRIDEEIERQTIELYRQGLSKRIVGEELGISQWNVHKILVRTNEPRRSLSEALMRYPKTDFSGDLAEKARIIGFVEDCGAGFNGKQVHVQTGTTHPAMIKLFNYYFDKYGHVSKTSDYNYRCSLYQWQLQVLLKTQSFGFLVEYKKNPIKFLAEIAENCYEIDRIGSSTDAEGWVGIEYNSGYVIPVLSISNNNRPLLEWTQRTIGGCIGRNNDCYKLNLFREEVVETLRRLPLAHEEKVAAKELVLRYADNGGIGVEALRAYRELRRQIDEEVRLCNLQARLDWIRRHGRPHRYDRDQTIPEI